jgi:hypothetical protein
MFLTLAVDGCKNLVPIGLVAKRRKHVLYRELKPAVVQLIASRYIN